VHTIRQGKNMKAPRAITDIPIRDGYLATVPGPNSGIDGIEALELEQADGEVIWQLRQSQRGRVLSTGSGEFPQGIDEKAGLVGRSRCRRLLQTSATR
jgi:hypothetical protein